jgi:hypothetical protein
MPYLHSYHGQAFHYNYCPIFLYCGSGLISQYNGVILLIISKFELPLEVCLGDPPAKSPGGAWLSVPGVVAVNSGPLLLPE